MKIYRNITELIGSTPLLELANYDLRHGLNAVILAKLEAFNPAGSVKDRIALAMVDAAEASGRLKPDSVIIEPAATRASAWRPWLLPAGTGSSSQCRKP